MCRFWAVAVFGLVGTGRGTTFVASLASDGTAVIDKPIDSKESTVKSWWNELLPEQTVGPLNVNATMAMWGVTEEMLEELLVPTEEKVNALIDAAILTWTDVQAEKVPEEVRREMLRSLERARVLGLQQVHLFNSMVELKDRIDNQTDDADDAQQAQQEPLRAKMLANKQKFLQLQEEEEQIFMQQDATRRKFLSASESFPFSLDSIATHQVLKFRTDAILRRFRSCMP